MFLGINIAHHLNTILHNGWYSFSAPPLLLLMTIVNVLKNNLGWHTVWEQKHSYQVESSKHVSSQYT